MSGELMLRILAGVVGTAFFLVLAITYVAGRMSPIDEVRDGFFLREEHPLETLHDAFRAALWFSVYCGSFVIMSLCILVAVFGLKP